VVGVSEPRFVTAFWTVAKPGDGAYSWHRNGAHFLAIEQKVSRDLAHRMVAARNEEYRLV
jgi:hypothetical protein